MDRGYNKLTCYRTLRLLGWAPLVLPDVWLVHEEEAHAYRPHRDRRRLRHVFVVSCCHRVRSLFPPPLDQAVCPDPPGAEQVCAWDARRHALVPLVDAEGTAEQQTASHATSPRRDPDADGTAHTKSKSMVDPKRLVASGGEEQQGPAKRSPAKPGRYRPARPRAAVDGAVQWPIAILCGGPSRRPDGSVDVSNATCAVTFGPTTVPSHAWTCPTTAPLRKAEDHFAVALLRVFGFVLSHVEALVPHTTGSIFPHRPTVDLTLDVAVAFSSSTTIASTLALAECLRSSNVLHPADCPLSREVLSDLLRFQDYLAEWGVSVSFRSLFQSPTELARVSEMQSFGSTLCTV